LKQAGVIANATGDLATQAPDDAAAAPSAIVFFPDEFPRDAVIVEIARLQRVRPAVLSVVVTREPRQFEGIVTEDGAEAPVIIPKPAWGWTILDVIRARLDSP